MEEFWEVFFEECKLAKKKGKHNIIDRERIKKFMRDNGLTDVLARGESNEQRATPVGFAPDDPSAADQWKSEKSRIALLEMLARFTAKTQRCILT
jgi:hypothetical protein